MRRLRGKDLLLTGIILRLCLLSGIFCVAVSCNNPGKERLPSGESFGNIIYETNIINRDSTDKWASECLSNFDRKTLINKVFNDLYNRKITPYDYFTGEKISPEKIRKMETEGEFSRENISKIRFEEKWIWDSEKVEMQKQLISMTISYEVFDNEGKSRGQKPIFKLKFKQE
ncbi:MAG: hypothetical protein NTY07_15815 [Bacteroidia bacterium]|nr:hypothetical protein [Bacteroidia bacterium]